MTVIQPWEHRFRGKRWRDMPGACDVVRKLNFALFRRGMISIEEAKFEERDDAEIASRIAAKQQKGIPARDPLRQPCCKTELAIVVRELRAEIRKAGLSEKGALKQHGLSENLLTPYMQLRNPSIGRLESLKRMLEKLKSKHHDDENSKTN